MAPPAIAIGLGVVGTIMDVVGDINESNSIEAQLRRKKKDRLIRARENDEAGLVEERNFKIMARRQIGNLKANAAARGISIKGSSADIIAESARAVNFDVQQIQKNTKQRSDALRRGAAGFGAAAEDESSSRFLRTIGNIAGGAGTLLKRVG